ncbi:exosortase A [Massilia yuzhufengensis]|uniref:Exosortase A n=1 Tax=Massilia yuzhufengensis TaxID=1164594 RepID=A0A1I1DL78_9BURK|nr:exosortase A [Massilia yuzhufengensis]SFB75112.1 exosortase A [Massilia yuzhufengensis]
MQLIPPPGLAIPSDAHSATRRIHIVIVLALLAPLAFYFGTAASIVSLWNSSETFAHGYVVAPISLWLAWRKRDVLRTLPLEPWWPALVLTALAGLGWLVATLGEVQVVRQYALVVMFPLAVLAVCGRSFAGALTFPLLFLLFAVPFGEVFVAPLIELTADFTVAALQLTGIPVLRNGTTFEIPSGHWSVVEACSGLRYLISSITLGCLYAYLSYQKWWRRALFIGLSIVVPIVANWLRAYMIVMIGHLSSMRLATGVDHIIYGWVFFGLVMFLMFWIGRLWQEDEATPLAAATPAAAPRHAPLAAFARASIAFIAVVALWPALAALNGRLTALPQPSKLAPVSLAWQDARTFTSWRPDYYEPDARLDKTVSAGGAPVALSILYYRNDNTGKPLISSVNRLAGEHNDYHEVGTERREERFGGRAITLLETRMAGPDGELLAWHWLRIGAHETTNAYVGKAMQARERLMLRAGDGAALIMTTPLASGRDDARAALRAFLDANHAAIDTALAVSKGH